MQFSPSFWQFSCVHCGQPLYFGAHGLCCRCRRTIVAPDYCGRCGAPLSKPAMGCGHCLAAPPAWEQMVVAGRYLEPLSTLIHRFKFQHQFWLDGTLARLLYLAVREARAKHGLLLPEALIPVPLHHWRQWQRGYNQADLLTDWLAKKLALPNAGQIVQRVKNTPTQRGLTPGERAHNVTDAFALNEKMSFPYQRVALIDDVITTGATLNSLSQLLRQAGAQHIQVWGLARA